MNHAIIWRIVGWCVSCLSSLVGLGGLAWLFWIVRDTLPRGPGESIALGFFWYAAITIRVMGGVGYLCFKESGHTATIAMCAWAVLTAALIVIPPPLTFWMKRALVIAVIMLAAGVDTFMFAQIKRFKR